MLAYMAFPRIIGRKSTQATDWSASTARSNAAPMSSASSPMTRPSSGSSAPSSWSKPLLEANGVDLSGKARREAFEHLLDEYGAQFNKDSRTLYSAPLAEAEIGAAAVRFVGLLLRIQDLALMSPQITRSNFREDALIAIHNAFDGRARIDEQAEVSPELVGQEADVVIRAPVPSAPPVGVYFATSEERALQALVVKMEAERYREIAASIILMVEHAKHNPVKELTLGLAMSRLDAVVSLRDSQQDTMERLAPVVGVNGPTRVLQ